MGTLVVVDVASHVVSQKSLERKLLSTVSALKHLFPVGNVLPFAVIQKLHLVTTLILEIIFLEVCISPCWQRDLHRWGSLPVALGSGTWILNFPLVQIFLNFLEEKLRCIDSNFVHISNFSDFCIGLSFAHLRCSFSLETDPSALLQPAHPQTTSPPRT